MIGESVISSDGDDRQMKIGMETRLRSPRRFRLLTGQNARVDLHGKRFPGKGLKATGHILTHVQMQQAVRLPVPVQYRSSLSVPVFAGQSAREANRSEK
jgi:hypothetical protein